MNIDGVRVNFIDTGEVNNSPTIILLHGWGADSASFGDLPARLAPHCRVCAPDLPGFGKSGPPPRGWSVDDYAGFTLSFIKALGVTGDVILLGHSFGGRIVIKLASSPAWGEPNLAKAVLIDSAGIRRRRTLRQAASLLLYKAARIALPERLTAQWRERRSSPDYRAASPVMRECLVKAVNEDLTHCLPLIRCPTLIFWGENDDATPLADGRLMERLIPDSGLVVLKGAGHYSYLEQKAVFGRVHFSFLNIET
ncbi:MAG: alpha/beta hydrolase [Synergistaceae bacterium]|jgi:pimeloyl-ACP methyl ester carboxylesterase|nr:alpha/beta hydrolase [Synergistaceae bacterium]